MATTAGFALSVLRPRGAKVLMALPSRPCSCPPIVLLVPLYLTVVKVPILRRQPGRQLLGDLAAGRPPARSTSSSCKRFFDNLPREIFEAAEVDGAGPFRLFWSVVLPMSRPIIGVVSVFAVIATWKDYLWPLLVLREPDIQPLSVRLPILAPTTDLGVFIAALTISSIFPIALFLHLPAPVPVGRRRERSAEGLAPGQSAGVIPAIASSSVVVARARARWRAALARLPQVAMSHQRRRCVREVS